MNVFSLPRHAQSVSEAVPVHIEAQAHGIFLLKVSLDTTDIFSLLAPAVAVALAVSSSCPGRERFSLLAPAVAVALTVSSSCPGRGFGFGTGPDFSFGFGVGLGTGPGCL